MAQITIDAFEKLLLKICDNETSFDPVRWTSKNRLSGHCAVVSVLAYHVFGGQIVRARMQGRYAPDMHYWNILPDGTEHDFTRRQFGKIPPRFEKVRRMTNDLVHCRIKGSKRYQVLLERFRRALQQAQ